MRWLLVLLLVPSVARADDAADRDLLVEFRRVAIEAAKTGNCQGARVFGEQVKQRDPEFYAKEFATDPVIAPCLAPPTSPAAIAPVDSGPPIAPPSETPPFDTRDTPPPHYYLPARPAVPPLDGGRLIGELIVGSLVGGGGLLVGGLLGAALCVDDGGDDFACLGSVVIGAYAVGSIGFGMGVALVGKAGAQTGSTGAAIGGALLGGLVGVLGVVAFADSSEGLAAALFIVSPAAGAMIGFNATRRWRDPQPMLGSLLRLDRGGVSLGVPLVVHGEQRGVPTTSVPLLSGSF